MGLIMGSPSSEHALGWGCPMGTSNYDVLWQGYKWPCSHRWSPHCSRVFGQVCAQLSLLAWAGGAVCNHESLPRPLPKGVWNQQDFINTGRLNSSQKSTEGEMIKSVEMKKPLTKPKDHPSKGKGGLHIDWATLVGWTGSERRRWSLCEGLLWQGGIWG